MGQQHSQSVRVASHLYPASALKRAAEQLSQVCAVDIQEDVDFFQVTVDSKSGVPEPHLLDEYLTLALMAMIEQRSSIR